MKTFLTINTNSKIKTELSGNIQDTRGNTVFEANDCAPHAIPVKAQKPSDKTKTENKEAQLRFNRAEIIFLPSSDITS